MTRLQFTTIAYAFTKGTDTQNAPYPIRGADSPVSIAVELLTTDLFYGWRQRARLPSRSHRMSRFIARVNTAVTRMLHAGNRPRPYF